MPAVARGGGALDLAEMVGFLEQPANLVPYDGEVRLFTDVVVDAAGLLDQLISGLEWRQHRIVVFNRMHDEPRLSAWYGEPESTYTYSGTTLEPLAWREPLVFIKDVCEQLTGAKFNAVLANLYRDGSDSMGWHADDEPELGPSPTIASVSLGAERRFDLRHRRTKETVRIPLPHNSVLVMSGATQSHWLHAVAKTKRVREPRVNLTYRLIFPELSRG